VANGTRSALPNGHTFVGVAADPRGRQGPGMLKLHEWTAEHAAAHSNSASAEEAAHLGGNLVERFTARVSISLHRAVMQALYNRWLLVLKRAELATGHAAVSAIDLRFQGTAP